MPEPELNVHQITKWVPPCESGRHAAHPYETCDEVEVLAAVVGPWFERLFAEAYASAARSWLDGNGSGEPLGFLEPARRQATPAERAFAILEPHLTDMPLYRPRVARDGILPSNVGATAEVPCCRPDCRWPVVS